MERTAEAPPRFKARMARVCQLLEGLTATFGQVIILGRLVIPGNAAATATNILGHERLNQQVLCGRRRFRRAVLIWDAILAIGRSIARTPS